MTALTPAPTKQLVHHYKIILLAFLLTLLAMLPLFVVFFNSFASMTAHTLDAHTLLGGFDRTVIEDMVYGKNSWSTILLTPLLTSLALYIVSSLFGQAGFMGVIVKKENNFRAFFKYGVKYFFAFMAYAIFFILMLAIASFIVYFIYTSLLGDPIQDHRTEKTLFYSGIGLMVWFILKAIGIWVWSIKTKFYYIQGHSFFKSILLGLKSSAMHIGNTIYASLILILSFALSLYFHNELIKMHTGHSWCTIIAVACALQSLLAIKYIVKTWALIFVAPRS